jgi:drug/metabolite transporter (DMT)-like permease
MHAASGRWKLGLMLALVTALFWGLLPIALAVVLRGLDAYTIVWYRFAAAGAALGLYLAWQRRLPWPAPLTGRGWMLLAVALAGLLANYVLYLLALRHTGPTAAQILIQLAPMFLLFGGLLVFRERFSLLQWAGFAVLAAGMLLFFHDRLASLVALGSELGVGVALMLAASLTWAIYALAQKQLLSQLASEQILFLLYLGAVILLLPLSHPGDVQRLDGLQLGLLAFCCANTVIAYGCFAEALEHWEVSRVSAVVTLAPLVTLSGMLAAARLWPDQLPTESLTVLRATGAFVVVAGAMITALGARPVSDLRATPNPQQA